MQTRVIASGPAALVFLAVLAAVSPAAAAMSAYASAAVNLRAGPGTQFPVVRTVPAGVAIVSYGCLADYTWCDVGYAGARGFVAARYVTVVSNGARVAVTPPVAVRIGMPVVVYSPSYWNIHYRAYPWYGRGPDYYRPVHPCRFGCSAERSVTGPGGRQWHRSVTIGR